MRKLILHLAIACSTFVVSVFVTNIWKLLSRADVLAQTLQPAVSESGPIVSTAEPGLVEIYRDYASAQTKHDLAFFERVEADDFMAFLGDGERLSRSEDIQWLKDSPTDIVYKYDDLNMQIYGGAAIVTGRMTATYSDGYSYSWRWIDVCVKRGGRWEIQSSTHLD